MEAFVFTTKLQATNFVSKTYSKIEENWEKSATRIIFEDLLLSLSRGKLSLTGAAIVIGVHFLFSSSFFPLGDDSKCSNLIWIDAGSNSFVLDRRVITADTV